MKKMITLILAAILILSTAPYSYGAGFSDIKSSNWAYEAVNAMSNKAIISGYPDGSFKPSNTVTTGEFIKMALIAATGEDVGNSNIGNWASNYYNKALELGYFTKYDIAKTDLDKKITRAHMALIISSILGDVKIDNYDKIQDGIEDITYKTPYEYDITKSYACGILTGYSDKTFRPDKTLSRAESATVIYRLADESKRIIPTIGGVVTPEKTLAEIITNYKSFKLNDGSIDEDLAQADSYEIVNGSSYGLTLGENNGTKWVHFPTTVESTLGLRYRMKDGKIVQYMDSVPLPDGSANCIYKVDITTVDYIVSLDINDHIILISNPFKK